jgi:hypothetical protein
LSLLYCNPSCCPLATLAITDPENFVEEEDLPAIVAAVYTARGYPVELEYKPGAPFGRLLADIDNAKTKIRLIIPVWNLYKEEANTLSLSLPAKRAKSPTGTVIKKEKKYYWNWRLARKDKEFVKGEEKEEEEEVKVEEADNNFEFPEIDKLTCKRRYIPSSKYPKDQYNLE